MTHIPGKPVKFDLPGDWKPCSPYSDGSPSRCQKCSGLDVRYRVHSSSCGGYDDDEIKCLTCGHVRWVDGIDS